MVLDIELKVFLIYVAVIAIMFLFGKLLFRFFVNGVIGAIFVVLMINILN